jgi:glycosyltransferase involved in cell wall biosynthesis
MPTASEINSFSSSPGPAAHGVPLAIISNALAPYRAALQQRVAREMPEVALWSIFTHQVSNAAWAFEPPAEIRATLFGEGEQALEQDRPSRALHEWRKGGRIIRWLKEHRIRAVLLEGYNDLGRLRILRWCSRNGVPVMLWGDSNIRGDRRRGMAGAIKRMVVSRILRRCSAALACGIGGRQYFAKYGVRDDRIFYYPVEPDYGLIERLPASALAAAAGRFGLAADRRRLVFSGRLIPVKRPDLVIAAFAAIAGARPEWDLVIMGDGPMRPGLEKRVPAGLRERVIWTGFIGEQETVSAVYRSCDVLVLPSDFEPWALAVNEAAAAGLAIVASDVVGAAAELVRDGVNGFCFPAGDLNALADRLLRTTDPAEIDRLKRGSAEVLADWRRRGDPIAGLRQALRAAAVLPEITG